MTYNTVGLGDVLAAIFAKLGIHPLGNCGCDKRRKALNNIPVGIIQW